jgi:hypothetical protein
VTNDFGSDSSAFGKKGTYRETEFRKRLPTCESIDEMGKATWPTKPISPISPKAEERKKHRNSVLGNNMANILSQQVRVVTQGLG